MIKRLPPLLLLTIAATAWSASRDAQWSKVDDAINKGLPKTAISELEPIIRNALNEKAFGEAAKAIARKIVLEGNIQGNKPEEKITRMEAEIAIPTLGLRNVQIAEGDTTVWQSNAYVPVTPGLTRARATAGAIVVQAGSGAYHLTLKAAAS